MTTKLTTELKNQASVFMLDTSKQLILTNFDKINKIKNTINIENEISVIEIQRNCFNDNSLQKPYYEDYRVSFSTIIQNQKIKSVFYLEWKNNNINTELIPANTSWNPTTGKCSNRKIKIKRCIK